MAGLKNQNVRFVIPDLTPRECREVKKAIIDAKRTYAPEGIGFFLSGPMNNVSKMLSSINRKNLKG